ncbi:hypothetical protein ABZZ47_14940 [Streptomyces sp. NPDC006465]|uniref:hypothetical protein n=1 Tax=Streptomyces sp. NPDC006465 TaxID=3157174 RepID=UPI00339E505C
MSGTTDSETRDHQDRHQDHDQGVDRDQDEDPGEDQVQSEDGDEGHDEDEGLDQEVRRARWTAVGSGALLTVAGLAASALRSTGSGTALIPVSYASGAAVCAVASLLGARGRTRRALWLMIAGVMVMAVGDQFD